MWKCCGALGQAGRDFGSAPRNLLDQLRRAVGQFGYRRFEGLEAAAKEPGS
jgi:hypothetical protein